MTDIEQVRTIISDHPQYSYSTIVADGVATEFQIPYAPIYPDSEKIYVDGALTDPVNYTIDDDLGLVVMATPPGEGLSISLTAKFTLLTDIEIQGMLDLEGDVKLAAAACLDIIASSEAMLQKKIRNLDFDTDGPAVAKSLREHAKTLRDQVAVALEISAQDGFEVIEMVYDTFGLTEKVIKDWEREG